MHSTLRSASRLSRGLHRTASRRIWGLSTHTAPANTPAEASRIQRWSARLSLENTYLSFTRNAIICTVAGGALIQYQKSEGKPPLALLAGSNRDARGGEASGGAVAEADDPFRLRAERDW